MSFVSTFRLIYNIIRVVNFLNHLCWFCLTLSSSWYILPLDGLYEKWSSGSSTVDSLFPYSPLFFLSSYFSIVSFQLFFIVRDCLFVETSSVTITAPSSLRTPRTSKKPKQTVESLFPVCFLLKDFHNIAKSCDGIVYISDCFVFCLIIKPAGFHPVFSASENIGCKRISNHNTIRRAYTGKT